MNRSERGNPLYESLQELLHKKLRLLQQLRQETLGMFNGIKKELEETENDMEKLSKSIDLIAIVALGVAKIFQLGFKAAAVTCSRKLGEINKELLKTTAEMAFEPIKIAVDGIAPKWMKDPAEAWKFGGSKEAKSWHEVVDIIEKISSIEPSALATSWIGVTTGETPKQTIDRTKSNISAQQDKIISRLDEDIAEVYLQLQRVKSEFGNR